jgi:hypothetical protein
MTLAMLLPCFTFLGSIAALHFAWWVLGDLILEHVGIPFVDGGIRARRRVSAADAHVMDRTRRSGSA